MLRVSGMERIKIGNMGNNFYLALGKREKVFVPHYWPSVEILTMVGNWMRTVKLVSIFFCGVRMKWSVSIEGIPFLDYCFAK